MTSKEGRRTPLTRRESVVLLALGGAGLLSGAARASDNAYGPGVTDTEIKIGQTIAYSGPASSLGVSGRSAAAYYRMVNDKGGVNGRKITLISADDAYSPPKTVEQTRRLVEQEGVLGMFGSIGAGTNASVQRYLNDHNPKDKIAVFGYFSAAATTQVLSMCGDNLSRENVLNKATHLSQMPVPMFLPGITMTTTPEDYVAVKQMQLQQFDGKGWVKIGGVVQG